MYMTGHCLVLVSIEEFEDTKGVIKISKSKDRHNNVQVKKDKQRSLKHFTENLNPG